MEEYDKDWLIFRLVGGWMFLLVLAHPGSPGQRVVKQLLLLLLPLLLIKQRNFYENVAWKRHFEIFSSFPEQLHTFITTRVTRHRASTSMISSSAQLRGITYHSPKLHPGTCNSLGMRLQTDRQTHTHTHRRARPQYISCRLRLTQNVTNRKQKLN